MAKMTIAQQREREVVRLASAKSPEYTESDLREARRLMNSFYRLAGLDERLLYLENTESTCNNRRTKQLSEKAYNWYTRLSKELGAFCGYKLTYFGHLPTITDADNNKKISAFYYD